MKRSEQLRYAPEIEESADGYPDWLRKAALVAAQEKKRG